jgi:CRISPR/Cas system-associated protein endoribonuclease Cas2
MSEHRILLIENPASLSVDLGRLRIRREATIIRLRPLIPKDAQVAFFIVTDKQYGMTKVFVSTRPTRNKPNQPEQVGLF